jgi:hypothetical protein
MELVVEIHSHLGLKRKHDSELQKMQQPTNIAHLTEAAQKVETQNGGNCSPSVQSAKS